MELTNYRTNRQGIIYLRDKGWSINALYVKFPSMDVEHILKEEGIPTPIITVTSRSVHKIDMIQSLDLNLDLDGEIIKPAKGYKQILAEAEKRSKRLNKIANL